MTTIKLKITDDDVVLLAAVLFACGLLVTLYGLNAAIVTGGCAVLARPLIDMANHAIAYRLHCHRGLVMRLELAEPQAKHDALTRFALAVGLHLLYTWLLKTDDIGAAATMTATALGIAIGARLLLPSLAVYGYVRRRAATVHGPARYR